VVSVVAPDGLSFTLLFNSFVAQAGPGIPKSQNKQDCRVKVLLHVPAGQSGIVTSVDTRGFVELSTGVVASETSEYRFPGNVRASDSSSFTGPVVQDYLRQDVIQSTVTSRCGGTRKARIHASLNVDNSADPAGSGVITVDTTDGQIRQVFNMAFSPCSCANENE
jgi:hypothetical protein